jgi:hypothetical protein
MNRYKQSERDRFFTEKVIIFQQKSIYQATLISEKNRVGRVFAALIWLIILVLVHAII